jgi:NAD(P)-dependent dehydrogenase (short-subunit alcohol dehydrogenase family)
MTQDGLAGRTVAITGGARGIGAVYARAFAERGAKVAIADLAEEAGEALAAELREGGARAVFARTDVTDEAGVRALVEVAERELGAIEVLVNNAAIYMDLGGKLPFEEIDPAAWDLVMAVNVRGAWQCAKAVAPAMRASGWGRIVNVTSGAAYNAPPGFAHYIASKAAVIGLTRALARELGPHGVTVNAVAPGLVDNDASQALNEQQHIDRATAARAIPRGMTPRDLIGAVLFLAGPESEFVTGQALIVDGGAVMG